MSDKDKANLLNLLESEGGHDGLLAFLRAADHNLLQIEWGEPANPREERVKTYIKVLPRYADSVVLFLYPDTELLANWKMYRNFMVPHHEFKRADEKTLQQIGMQPGRCHPFFDLRNVEDETVQGVYMDIKMARRQELHNFPIYSTTSERRIGSIYMPPWYYVAVMAKLVGDNAKERDYQKIVRTFGLTDET